MNESSEAFPAFSVVLVLRTTWQMPINIPMLRSGVVDSHSQVPDRIQLFLHQRWLDVLYLLRSCDKVNRSIY
jgi:hypothetical protein